MKHNIAIIFLEKARLEATEASIQPRWTTASRHALQERQREETLGKLHPSCCLMPLYSSSLQRKDEQFCRRKISITPTDAD